MLRFRSKFPNAFTAELRSAETQRCNVSFSLSISLSVREYTSSINGTMTLECAAFTVFQALDFQRGSSFRGVARGMSDIVYRARCCIIRLKRRDARYFITL